MKLYLVRHAKAEDGTGMTAAEDDARELTKKGRRQMKRVAKLVREKASISRIITSPLPRAEQTARILGRVLDVPVTEAQALQTPTTLTALETFLETERKDGLAIVAHEPYLTQLARSLLGKFPAGRFKKGAVLALDLHVGEGNANFEWMVLPKGPRVIDSLDVIQSRA